MARIPVYEAQQGLETDRGGLPRYQALDAAAGALGQLGNTIESVGGAIANKRQNEIDKATAEKDRFDDFKTKVRFQQWRSDVEAEKTKLEEATPETGDGFATGYKSFVARKADEFLKDVPEKRQEEYKFRLGIAQEQYGKVADDTEHGFRQNYQRKSLSAQLETFGNKVAATPENWRSAAKALDDIVELSDLPEKEKADLRSKNEKLMFDAALAGYKEQGRFDDARKAVDDRHGVLPVAAKPIKAGGPVQQIIADAAARHGVDAQTLIGIANIESRLNPRAKNPRSSAGGLFQQIDSNASQYGVSNRFDPKQSADGAARFLKDNQEYLTKALGRNPTPGELYLAHQQGPGGAAKLLRNPNARAADVVGNAAVKLNGGSPNMTAGEFTQLWTNKLDGKNGIPVASGGSFHAEVTSGSFSERDASLADIDTAEKQATTLAVAQKTADYKGRLNALLVDIHDGKAGEADILEARTSWLGDAEDIGKADAAYKKRNEDGDNQASVAARIADGGFVNPADDKDRKGVDALFKNAGTPDDIMNGKPQTVGAMYAMYDSTGMVPKSAKDAVHAMVNGRDGARIITGLSFLDEFERRNPRAFKREFTEDDERLVMEYRSQRDFSTPEQIAKGLTESRDAVTEEVKKVREKEAEKQVKDIELGDVTNLFDNSYLPFNEPEAIDQGASDALMSDYRKLVVDEFKTVGDMDKAMRNAAQRLTRTWGVSVAAAGRIMKFPPENYYAPVKGAFDWMKKSIETDLMAKGYKRDVMGARSVGKAMATTKVGSEALPYYIVPDATTRAEISANVLPSYQVWVQDENGVFDVVRDKAGKASRYKWDALEAVKAREELAAQQQDNAKGSIEMNKAFEDTRSGADSTMNIWAAPQ